MTPILRHRSDLTGSEVWEGDARDVAAAIPDDTCSLAIFDGAYGYGKSKVWDSVKVADLPEWYRPFLEDADRVLAPSASLYFWNTAEGWAAVHPVILSMGWTFATTVVYRVTGAHPAKIGEKTAKRWTTVTEFCGMYTRGHTYFRNQPGLDNVWDIDRTNTMRNGERLTTGRRILDRVNEGWMCEEPLHPCQKPLIFAERMIRASTRSGETIWAPFGGTLREAVAAERIARADPNEVRRVITAELNQDGVDYIGPALRQMQGLGTRPVDPRQIGMFGAKR